jgi:uncharacterized membrane protein YhiD involved in acid resistance
MSGCKTKSGSLSPNIIFSQIWTLKGLTQEGEGTSVGAGSPWPSFVMVVFILASLNVVPPLTRNIFSPKHFNGLNLKLKRLNLKLK